MTDNLKASLAHWPELSQSVFVPHTEMEYQRLVVLLDQLVDEVGNDESHPLASLMEIVGLLIEKYEDEQVPELEESSAAARGTAVPFLMESPAVASHPLRHPSYFYPPRAPEPRWRSRVARSDFTRLARSCGGYRVLAGKTVMALCRMLSAQK